MVHMCYAQLIQARAPPAVTDAKSERIACNFNFETFCSIGTTTHFNFPPEFFQSSTLKALVSRFVDRVGYERVAVACYNRGLGTMSKYSLPTQTLGFCGGVASCKGFFLT